MEMASVKWFYASIVVLFCIFSTVACLTEGNCSEKVLRQCKESFDENTTPLCGEIRDLKECLIKQSDCEHSKHVMLRYTFRVLSFKLHTHAACIDGEKAKKKCNESLARTCYENFNGNATRICKEVKRLRYCLDGLQGCHVMKHPSFTLSESILDKYRRCFFVNYSKILEVLERKTDLISTHTKIPINSTAAANIDEMENSSNALPYTFVVVATVCTCLFLVILVVFSVVRHTSLMRRQRNSTVERPPIRLQISPCRTSQRTRRSLRRNGRRSRRRHMYVIHEARQTVSGFFEGNVPPPPYSAVLDETESLRAGDLPPPYQPQQFVAIGVIV